MMSSTNLAAGLRLLSEFRQWTKQAAAELLQEEDVEAAKSVMDLLQRSKDLEKILEVLLGSRSNTEFRSSVVATEAEARPKYPIFFVDGNCLIKQGETRDKRDIYEQRLPRVEFERIVDKLRKIADEKPEFEIRDVLSELSVPNYQAYLLLGALQLLGLIQVPRRGMYSFVEPKRFRSESHSAWQRFSAQSQGERR